MKFSVLGSISQKVESKSRFLPNFLTRNLTGIRPQVSMDFAFAFKFVRKSLSNDVASIKKSTPEQLTC